MMPDVASSPRKSAGLNGWVEAGLFAIALSVLNVSYGVGSQIGAHPVAFLVCAMLVAALSLLALTGPGPDWAEIVRHPLSFVVGFGIIAMEAVYYILVQHSTPTEGSLLVRLNVPMAALLGFMFFRRRPSWLGLVGQAVVCAAILGFALHMDAQHRTLNILLAAGCGAIMSGRAFATEFHPWNQAAQTISEKMRLTGLVLLVTSIIGSAIVFGLMALAAHGVIAPSVALPEPHHFLHTPTILLGLFVGAVVLTTMQYLGFSVVVKIQAQNFIATTALIPLMTLAMQLLAVQLGILAPVPVDWKVLPAMLLVAAGVVLVIAGGQRLAR